MHSPILRGEELSPAAYHGLRASWGVPHNHTQPRGSCHRVALVRSSSLTDCRLFYLARFAEQADQVGIRGLKQQRSPQLRPCLSNDRLSPVRSTERDGCAQHPMTVSTHTPDLPCQAGALVFCRALVLATAVAV